MRIYKGYGFFSVIYLFFCKIYTFLFFRKCKIIRLPFRLRVQGAIKLSPGLSTGIGNRIDVFDNATLTIGSNVQINDYCHIACSQYLSIGNDTLIASRVFITDHDHDFNCKVGTPASWPLLSSDVVIGDSCWIGEGVSILKGVNIGNNCIVGSNSVVTRSFPDNCIVAGVPAKIIRTR